MSTTRKQPWRRRLLGVVGAVALALPVAAGGSAASPAGDSASAGSVSDMTPDARMPGKRFAAYDYDWYPISFVDHFIGPLAGKWRTSGNGYARTQNGMYTLYNRGRGSVQTIYAGTAHDRGRWEMRMRARSYTQGRNPVTATVELVPAFGRSQRCGARDITLTRFVPKRSRTHFVMRNTPNRQWTASKRLHLSDDYWHTYAVEVRPHRVTWFVDARPVAQLKSRVGFSGVPLTWRMALEGNRRNNNISRLQIDTVRYFSLKSRGKGFSARVPAPSVYRGAC